MVLDKPKTETSIRTIRIGKESIGVLNNQKERLGEEKKKSKELWQDRDFVFPSTIGTAMDPSSLVKKFKQYLKSGTNNGGTSSVRKETSFEQLVPNLPKYFQ
ncbi:MAG: hypothetical protein V3V66_03615 [Anaerolineales bacterium]